MRDRRSAVCGGGLWPGVVLALAATGAACVRPGVDDPAAPAFVDVAAEAGLAADEVRAPRRMAHILDSLGSGVAVGDYDGDGDEDVYLVAGQTTDALLAGEPFRPNALYRNEGDGTFTDVAAMAGVDRRHWGSGAWFVDYDNDGDQDLFVTAWGPNVLYRNEGDGTFTDVSAASGLAGSDGDWSAGAAFADLDFDGDLDLYVARYCAYDPRDPQVAELRSNWKGIEVFAGPDGLPGQADSLYRNNGDGTFTDLAAEAGLAGVPDFHGLAVVISDLDGDRDPDIYVANNSAVNVLWRNDGNLTFTEVATRAGAAAHEGSPAQAGMGVDSGDYDGDGRLDLIVTNFSHDWNALSLNDGDLLFLDATVRAGLQDSYLDLSWGARFVDWDNDGLLDLFVANGHVYPQVDAEPRLETRFKQRNKLYRNRGDGSFENVSASGGEGLAVVESSRAVAVADFDRDGRQDLFVTNLDAPPNLLLNRTGGEAGYRWLAVRLVGRSANRDGVGARLELDLPGRTLVREASPYASYLSGSSHWVHFGLGEAETTERLIVHWPSGHTDLITGLDPGLFYTVAEGEGVIAESGPVPGW